MATTPPKKSANAKPAPATKATKPAAASKAATHARKNKSRDYFALLTSIGAVIVVAGAMAFYFFTHDKVTKKTEHKQNYVQMPQVIVESDTQVARLQFTIQVAEEDHDWLEKNKQAIGGMVQLFSKEIDPAKFRTDAGRQEVLTLLRDDLNSQLHSDKIRGVLYADMLVEERVDD